jgi:hypothetical protein
MHGTNIASGRRMRTFPDVVTTVCRLGERSLALRTE